MAAELEKRFGVKPQLHKGSGGVFDVKADGELIFSKHQTGRFPEQQEIVDSISRIKH